MGFLEYGIVLLYLPLQASLYPDSQGKCVARCERLRGRTASQPTLSRTVLPQIPTARGVCLDPGRRISLRKMPRVMQSSVLRAHADTSALRHATHDGNQDERLF